MSMLPRCERSVKNATHQHCRAIRTVSRQTGPGAVTLKSRNFLAHFRWHKSLWIFKTKASRGTKLCIYFNFDSLNNTWKNQLYRISGSEYYKWLSGLERFSGISRNGPLLLESEQYGHVQLVLGGHFWQFSKCSHFSNISSFFAPFFCIEQLQCVVETFLACFYAFWIFDPKWQFCKVYSLCLVAIFGHFQNALIFPILAVFSSRILHRTTAMCCRNVFSMFLCIFNFWPKVTILQSL